MVKRFLTSTVLALCIVSCNNVQVRDNNIVVTPKTGEAKKVRLQVLSPEIIRVNATPERKFAKDASLVVLEQEKFTDFKVEHFESKVVVTTSALKAELSLEDGKVSFYKADGTPILAENTRSFQSIEVDNTTGYTVTQTFDSFDANEALYGLGQHQSEEFNYKGKSEELFQYNTKVSVPLVISTSNYAILWDSYSYCRFGNPNAWQELSDLKAEFVGTYTAPGVETLIREETNINFDHLLSEDLSKVHGLPVGFPMQDAHITYEGFIYPSQSGIYDFSLYYSGYQSVEINGEEVVPERWRTAWNPNTYKFSVELEAGSKVPVKIDWKPNGGVAYCGLKFHAPESEQEKNQIRWWSEMQQMEDYYVMVGNSSDEVISNYRTLTGKATIMPKWAMGYWQSREKYNTQHEVLDVLNTYRKLNIPIDNIVIDWLHWEQDSWGSHEFDKARFPDPKAMVDSIHAMDARVMISVWPKFYVNTEHYKEFDQNGWMYQRAVQDSIKDWVGPGYVGSFYDAYNADARKLFWNQMYEHYYPLGMDAWWMDASEPNVRDCTDMDYRKALCGPTALGSSTEYFNAYALVNADAIYNGQREVDPNKRVFLLTRSGFAGQQRYATATWSGDIATRWEDMRAQITAGLNFSACGIPYWTMDIGGFCVEDKYSQGLDMKQWKELNARWFQFGAFSALYRAHGQYPYREIYNIASAKEPEYESMVYYTRLRYALMPYIYSLAGQSYFDDYTIMRALFMDFPNDLKVRDLGDQYMFGPAFMVAPVCEYGARSRELYLPEGIWYDYYTNVARAGAKTYKVSAPLTRMPLFVRGGSIVPMGEVLQSTAQKQQKPLDIYVYAGADAQFALYEDEGVNYNYEKGQFSRINFIWDEANSTLTIDSRQGEGYDGMDVERDFNIVLVNSKGVKKGHLVHYNGTKISVKL